MFEDLRTLNNVAKLSNIENTLFKFSRWNFEYYIKPDNLTIQM